MAEFNFWRALSYVIKGWLKLWFQFRTQPEETQYFYKTHRISLFVSNFFIFRRLP